MVVRAGVEAGRHNDKGYAWDMIFQPLALKTAGSSMRGKVFVGSGLKALEPVISDIQDLFLSHWDYSGASKIVGTFWDQ